MWQHKNIPNHSVTVPVSGFTSIKWTTVDGNNFIGVAGIKVDGKLLVDSGVSVPAVPSIGSEVRANPAAGFSVVTYTGTGSNGTIGHGLGVSPSLIITKNRTTSGIDWIVYHPALDSGKVLLLNSSLAQFVPGGGSYGTITSTTYGVTIGSNVWQP